MTASRGSGHWVTSRGRRMTVQDGAPHGATQQKSEWYNWKGKFFNDFPKHFGTFFEGRQAECLTKFIYVESHFKVRNIQLDKTYHVSCPDFCHLLNLGRHYHMHLIRDATPMLQNLLDALPSEASWEVLTFFASFCWHFLHGFSFRCIYWSSKSQLNTCADLDVLRGVSVWSFKLSFWRSRALKHVFPWEYSQYASVWHHTDEKNAPRIPSTLWRVGLQNPPPKDVLRRFLED